MTSISNRSTNGLRVSLLIATACLIGAASWVLVRGDNLPGKPKLADKPDPDKDAMNFAAVFATNCAGCHGADGKSGPAPPLNDPLFRAIVPEKVLADVISFGRPGTPMPGFATAHGGTLPADQILLLVSQIKGFPGPMPFTPVTDLKPVPAPDWGMPKPALLADVPPYEAGKNQPPRTSKDYETIRTTLFARACADCHGDHGEGTDSARAINNHDFLALASDALLRRIIITGLPELGMPDYQSSDQRAAEFTPLKSAEIDDLVALLGQWRSGKSADAK